MVNHLVLMGRLVRDPEIVETENGKKYTKITLAIPRSFKNADGIYDTDFIDIMAWNNIAENTKEYCKKGDVLGVRGRLQSSSYQDKEGNNKTKIEVVAERISFLTSREQAKNKDDKDAR